MVVTSSTQAAFDKRFHGASAGARGSKDDDFVASSLENLLRVFDAQGGVAELAGDDERLVDRGGRLSFHHAANRPRGAGQQLS